MKSAIFSILLVTLLLFVTVSGVASPESAAQIDNVERSASTDSFDAEPAVAGTQGEFDIDTTGRSFGKHGNKCTCVHYRPRFCNRCYFKVKHLCLKKSHGVCKKYGTRRVRVCRRVNCGRVCVKRAHC
eukprot:IDg11835t1